MAALPPGSGGLLGGFDAGMPELARDAGFDADAPPELDDLDAEAAGLDAPARAAVAMPAADEGQLAAWIARVVDHDERALAALYDATAARLFALATRIVRSAALAEEVVEDTFWQVWRQAPRFDAARGRALTWLMAMARSRAIDALRHDARFRHDELPDDDQIDGATDTASAPPDLLEATRREHRLHQALAQLDAQPRQLLALAFFRGLTHEEIAAQTELPLGTVKSQIRRALQALKTLLDAPDPPAAASATPAPR